MNITIKQAQKVIKTLKEEDKKLETFSSHKFIGAYIKEFESDYINMLAEYENKQTSKDTSKNIGKLHSKIGSFLKRNEKELGIISDGKVTDMNIHHSETPSEKWNIV
ncbi:hypothetical protein [Prevotella sp.]|uniref:hypothetical protein n=1 Tax=Prevotella sp. TaxID=59823 RepID=UPI003DA45575